MGVSSGRWLRKQSRSSSLEMRLNMFFISVKTTALVGSSPFD